MKNKKFIISILLLLVISSNLFGQYFVVRPGAFFHTMSAPYDPPDGSPSYEYVGTAPSSSKSIGSCNGFSFQFGLFGRDYRYLKKGWSNGDFTGGWIIDFQYIPNKKEIDYAILTGFEMGSRNIRFALLFGKSHFLKDKVYFEFEHRDGTNKVYSEKLSGMTGDVNLYYQIKNINLSFGWGTYGAIQGLKLGLFYDIPVWSKKK